VRVQVPLSPKKSRLTTELFISYSLFSLTGLNSLSFSFIELNSFTKFFGVNCFSFSKLSLGIDIIDIEMNMSFLNKTKDPLEFVRINNPNHYLEKVFRSFFRPIRLLK